VRADQALVAARHRPGKPRKVKANTKRPLTRESPADHAGAVRSLEKRLAEAVDITSQTRTLTA
jgi:hypothetical protein